MLLLYNIGIRLYFFMVRIASFFDKKARLWIEGRKNQNFIPCSESLWFHFASLGEFEQGRPVLEQLRLLQPGTKLIVTFFSSSGYEVRKHTELADAVYYLPLDTGKNAREFFDAINPRLAIFTKYEYWFHFFNEAHKRNIPLYLISGIFRPEQVFFKWYGALHRKMLGFVSCFFVQDEQSKLLLSGIGIHNAAISGDTRFDRVWANSQNPKHFPAICRFKNGQHLVVAGSTWRHDEKLVATLVNQYPDWKFIFAPHEIDDDKIDELTSLLPAQAYLRYSELVAGKEAGSCQVLIIDNIGMLSALYQYGDIAYIGGGFGAGIHNTLEAAAFGVPVIFGPNYSKFKEAHDLVALRAGFSVQDELQLKGIMETLVDDPAFCRIAGKKSKEYVSSHTGATKMIMETIKAELLK